MMNKIIQPCVNRPAIEIPDWKYCKYEAEQLRKFLKETKFDGKSYSGALSLSHTYVSQAPLHFFIINEQHNKGELLRTFGSWCIVNLKIIKFSELVYSKETCLAFPFRQPKTIIRANQITVEYQIPFLNRILRKKKKDLEGLSAFICQHENDHAVGKNIYFN